MASASLASRDKAACNSAYVVIFFRVELICNRLSTKPKKAIDSSFSAVLAKIIPSATEDGAATNGILPHNGDTSPCGNFIRPEMGATVRPHIHMVDVRAHQLSQNFVQHQSRHQAGML